MRYFQSSNCLKPRDVVLLLAAPSFLQTSDLVEASHYSAESRRLAQARQFSGFAYQHFAGVPAQTPFEAWQPISSDSTVTVNAFVTSN